MTIRIRTLFFILLACTVMLAACQKRPGQRPQSTVAYNQKIGVAGFTQPTTTSQLLRGSLPDDQGIISADALEQLDSLLHQDLGKTKRLYTFLPVTHAINPINLHESGRPQALAYWMEFAQNSDVDLLLVPQVLNWHQREGSSAGVTEPAHVRAEFYLINVQSGQIVKFTSFEEKQTGLVDNMLGMGDFFKRKGAWVTAEELAQEAISASIKELGL